MTTFNRRRALSSSALMLLAALCCHTLATAANPPAAASAAIVPDKKIVLFNGKDLTNFYTHLVGHKYKDPNRVFTVVDQVDGAPAIRVSGEDWGGFISKENYANYHLVFEFKWGDITWGTRKDRTMDSGVLVHAQGPDGNSRPDFNGPWMYSIEYQLIEGGTGDFIRVGGHTADGKPRPVPSLTGTVTLMRNGQYNWDPNGQTRTFDATTGGGRQNWYGRDPDWKDVLGYRGAQDVENPVGQWNKGEIICKGDTIICILNGKTVNIGTKASLTSGKLLFQSEGAEIFFRRIDLYPVQ